MAIFLSGSSDVYIIAVLRLYLLAGKLIVLDQYIICRLRADAAALI